MVRAKPGASDAASKPQLAAGRGQALQVLAGLLVQIFFLWRQGLWTQAQDHSQPFYLGLGFIAPPSTKPAAAVKAVSKIGPRLLAASRAAPSRRLAPAGPSGPANLVEDGPAAGAFQERLSPLDRKKGDEKEAQIIVQPL